MALADRASALAPDDPNVTALIQTVTDGGRASRRKRILAIAGLGTLVAAGGTLLAIQLTASSPRPSRRCRTYDRCTRATEPVIDAPIIATNTLVDAFVEPPIDARITIARDAHVRDAVVVAIGSPPDTQVFPPVLPIDAQVDAAVSPGAIIVQNDAWCEITIDDVAFGQKRGTPLPISAGRHVVTCEQPHTPRHWTKEVVVGAGETTTVSGTVLDLVEVRFSIDATLDGRHFARGAAGTFKSGITSSRQVLRSTSTCASAARCAMSPSSTATIDDFHGFPENLTPLSRSVPPRFVIPALAGGRVVAARLSFVRPSRSACS